MGRLGEKVYQGRKNVVGKGPMTGSKVVGSDGFRTSIDPITGKKIDGRTKAGKALIDRKKAIIKESALLNAEIVGKMANMPAEDINSVFENNRVMRAKRREAAELGSEFNVSKYAQKRLKTLNDEYKVLQEELGVFECWSSQAMKVRMVEKCLKTI